MRSRHALVAALLLVSCATARAPRSDDAVGRTMDLDAERLNGAGRLRLADLRGRVVMVDVWTSWCVPCREAIPEWMALRERLDRARFEIVGVSTDEERDNALLFIEELTPSFPMVWDDGSLMVHFPVTTMPTIFLLDGGGVVRFVHVGYDAETPALIEAQVRQLLELDASPSTVVQ